MSRFPWQQSAAIAGAAVAPLMALTGFFSVAPMIRKKEPATESIMSFLPEDLKKKTRWVSNYCTNLIASQTLLPGQTGIIDRRYVYPVIGGIMQPGSAIITISKTTDIYCVGMAHVDEYSDILQTITDLERQQEHTAHDDRKRKKSSLTKEPFIINIVKSKGYANDDPSDIISKRETLKINNDIVVDGEITVCIIVGSGLFYLRPTSEAEKCITPKHADRASSMPKSLPNEFVLLGTRRSLFQYAGQMGVNNIADILKAEKSPQKPVDGVARDSTQQHSATPPR